MEMHVSDENNEDLERPGNHEELFPKQLRFCKYNKND
jgi:hypothetical protein